MTVHVKNLVTISLTIFIVVVIIILGAGAFMNQNKTSVAPVVQQDNNTSTNTNAGITAANVAKHNSYNDCWMIINNKIYNVTDYVAMHPGGIETIIPYCGKDATVAFDTKGGRGSHSQNAQNLLTNYYVGNLSR
jgi:cytochrome b involved in lipid metabolism